MLVASPGLALVLRERRWLGQRWSSKWVSGLRPRRGAGWPGRTPSGGAATAVAALFAARLPSVAVKLPPCFASEVAPEEGAAFFFGIVLIGCPSGVLVMRMIHFDRFSVSLGRFLGFVGVQSGRPHSGTFSRRT